MYTKIFQHSKKSRMWSTLVPCILDKRYKSDQTRIPGIIPGKRLSNMGFEAWFDCAIDIGPSAEFLVIACRVTKSDPCVTSGSSDETVTEGYAWGSGGFYRWPQKLWDAMALSALKLQKEKSHTQVFSLVSNLGQRAKVTPIFFSWSSMSNLGESLTKHLIKHDA